MLPDPLLADELSVIAAKLDKANRIRIFIGGKLADKSELQRLKQEAELLLSSHLWSILTETVKSKAIDQSLRESKTWEEVLSGKMMLHNLGLLESTVRAIEKAAIDD